LKSIRNTLKVSVKPRWCSILKVTCLMGVGPGRWLLVYFRARLLNRTTHHLLYKVRRWTLKVIQDTSVPCGSESDMQGAGERSRAEAVRADQLCGHCSSSLAWSLTSEPHVCKAGVLSFEPNLQPFALVFWRWCLKNYLSELASNLHPSNLSFPSR
jgi:hypothetical protein